jgi:MerR family transcriptional regulator, heat shock protein HspR
MALSSDNNLEPLGFIPAPELGIYSISVVGELTGITIGTLRGFERAGLLSPARTDGGTRRYSNNDLTRIRRICQLLASGVNFAGIGQILALETRVAQLAAEVQLLREQVAQLRAEK